MELLWPKSAAAEDVAPCGAAAAAAEDGMDPPAAGAENDGMG